MTVSARPWVTRLQILGLCAVWGITLAAIGWFGWSALWLRKYGDAWKHALVLGAVVGGVFTALASLLTYVFVALYKGEGGEQAVMPAAADEAALLRPITSPWKLTTYAVAAGLAGLVGIAGLCWAWQLYNGMKVLGLNRPVFWGLYVTNVDFLLGLSYGAVLLSAMLRLIGGNWRAATSRTAEILALVGICVAPLNIIFDLGRPERAYKMFAWGRMQSPLLWDVASISTYLITVVVFLYLPMIPDFAVLRDRVPDFRRHFYALASFGWSGTAAQKKALDSAVRALSVLAVFVAVTVRSVIAWVNGMTLQPSWHTSLLAPAYVLNALAIATAVLILALALERRLLKLSSAIAPLHFEKLGSVLLWLAVFWAYFATSENLTTLYGTAPAESAGLQARLSGHYAVGFWFTNIACFAVPLLLLARKQWRTIPRVVIAAAVFLLGIWNELYEGVVSALEQPRLPYSFAHYHPSFVEIGITIGCGAAVVLVMMIVSRLVPVVSLWDNGRTVAPPPGEVAAPPASTAATIQEAA